MKIMGDVYIMIKNSQSWCFGLDFWLETACDLSGWKQAFSLSGRDF